MKLGVHMAQKRAEAEDGSHLAVYGNFLSQGAALSQTKRAAFFFVLEI